MSQKQSNRVAGLLVAALLTQLAPARGEGPPLRIVGLSDKMTGWQELEAVVSDDRVDVVEWRLNGRSYPGLGPRSVRLYFGITPQPRSLELLARDRVGNLLYRVEQSVNVGGSGSLLDFVSPAAGSRVEGRTPVELCVSSPEDRPVERVEVWLEREGERKPIVEARAATGGRCRLGEAYRALVEIEPVPTVLSARLFTAGRLAAGEGPGWRDGENVLERSLVLNMPPATAERVDVRLLEWPVQVVRSAQPVLDLVAEDFALFEDRRRCRIRRIFGLEGVALRLALVFDWSGSTALDTSAEAQAATELMSQLFDPRKDSVMIQGIAASPIPYLGWTGDPERIGEALERIRTGYRFAGGTALYDTLMEVLYQFQSESKRGMPAVIVLTDGLDTASVDFDRRQVLAYARESGVPIFPLAVRSRLDRWRTTKADLDFLRALADESGGRVHVIELDGRADALLARARELRAEAESLRRQPGELAQDPRFLEHLIGSRVREASDLEAKAGRLERRNESPLEEIRRAFELVARELSTGYLLVAEAQAPRSDRWHPVEVELVQAHAQEYDLRAPRGLHW